MKTRAFLLCALLLTVTFVAAVPAVQAAHCAGASRFWVGGTGVWSNTSHWSATTGGAGGASVPGLTNPVVFDASSGLGTLTVDVTASSCDVTGTAMSLTAVSLGAQTWRVDGDITDMEGAKITIGTSTLELTGSTTQTIGLGVSTSNFNVYNLLVSGAGTKVVRTRFYVQGASWSATTSVTMQFKPDLTQATAAVFTLQAAFTIGATAGNVLTMQSQTAGSKWALAPGNGGTSRLFLQRVSISDATASIGVSPFVDATDVTNTDLGGNSANVKFTPRSSVVDSQTSPGLFIDYGPQVFRNRVGEIVVTYNDGSVNNGNWYVTYSTDGGTTWAARTTLMSPTAGGILTASTGAGQEIFGYVDKTDVLHIINHKLISEVTHLIYTRVDISNAANVADWMQYESARRVRAPSQGNAADGQGFDDLGVGTDASLAVLSDGTVVFGIDTSGSAVGPMAVQFYFPQANSYTSRTTLSFTAPVQDLAIVVSDSHDNLHFFTQSTIGGVVGIVYLRCDDAVRSDCTRAANWNGAAGGSTLTNDQVIFSASGGFGFPFATVDSEDVVHIASTSTFAVAGFNRVWHNYLAPGSTTWANGIGAAGGAEINAASAFPTRTRPTGNERNGFLTADAATNVYVFYTDQQRVTSTYHVFNGATRTWGDQTAAIYGSVPYSNLHSRAGSSVVDMIEFMGTTGPIAGIRWQGVSGTYGSNAWWDDVPDGGLPPAAGILRVAVSCAYNPFVVSWSCSDVTDYSTVRTQSLVRMTWEYDGRVVAETTGLRTSQSFAAGDNWLKTDGDHLLVVTWELVNGARPRATFVLHTDNRPAQVGMVLLGLVLLVLLIAAIVRRRGGAIAFERVQNPSYRRTAEAVEEYPKGWRSYRQVRHNPNLPMRSERRGNLWVIYQVRPATAAEQQRTGKTRIAYVQTVREKM